MRVAACGMQMALKAADISHLAGPLEIHRRWTSQLRDEFFSQGDSKQQTSRSQTINKSYAVWFAVLFHISQLDWPGAHAYHSSRNFWQSYPLISSVELRIDDSAVDYISLICAYDSAQK